MLRLAEKRVKRFRNVTRNPGLVISPAGITVLLVISIIGYS